MDKTPTKLTPYPEGSLRELWAISLPLMISSLATLAMIFVDRCFLARYSLNALNAAVNAGTLAWAFLGSMGMLTAMSEVFVAQYNGAKRLDKMSVPVWQMIWFSFFSIAIFIPVGIWVGPLFFTDPTYSSLQKDYFFYLMILGPAYPLMTAISGFYIGRGITRFLIYLAIIANFINILFDWILIFGIEGYVPAMGIKGAAIATCLGNIFQTVVLALFFFSKKNREKFNTLNWHFNFNIFKKCLKIGFPPAIFYALELIGWAFFYIMMTTIGEQHITISSICQSVTILLSFFFDGLTRGLAALAGNFIGSNRLYMIKKILKSALKLQVLFGVALSFFLLVNIQPIIDFLIPGNLENFILNWKTLSGHSFLEVLRTCLIYVFFYMIFEGVRWIFAGLLTAAGDTFFLLIAGSFSVWLFLLLPVYFIVVKSNLGVDTAWLLAALYAFLLAIIYWLRFIQGKWKNIKLLSDKDDVLDEAL